MTNEYTVTNNATDGGTTRPCTSAFDHFLKVHQMSQLADQILQESLGTLFDLTPRRAIVLEAIQNYPTSSQAQLIEKTGIDRSTMSGLIRSLLSASYIIRNSRDDRTDLICITKEGVAALKHAQNAAQIAAATMTDWLPQFSELRFTPPTKLSQAEERRRRLTRKPI